jgi:hypothetical protein
MLVGRGRGARRSHRAPAERASFAQAITDMDPHLILALFHIIAVVPLFLFVGFQRAATPEWLYHVLFGLGILILVYHGIKAVIRIWAKSASAWINVFHAALIAPLLIWIGYYGKKTGRPAYELLLMAGFAALGYHLKNLMVITQTFIKDD